MSYNWVAPLLKAVLQSELHLGVRLLKAVLQSDSDGAAQMPRCDSEPDPSSKIEEYSAFTCHRSELECDSECH